MNDATQMRHCDRCGLKFTNVLDAFDHNNNFKHHYIKMDPIKKARIVASLEAKIEKHIVYDGWSLNYGLYPQQTPVIKAAPKIDVKKIDIVIERFRNAAAAWETTPHVLPEPAWVG